MPKSLSTFLEECRREIPNEVVHIAKSIDPARHDATAIIKHLGAQKKFPIAIFEQPLNLHGTVSEFKLVLNCEISQRKTQIALNFPREMGRGDMAEACLAREAKLGLLVAIMAAFGLVLSFIVNLTLTWVTQPCGSVCARE